ncbi:hypothetical protein AB0G74_05470 [Streptomyces sp. NPDC020875]|uniref:hypothetical protein n=1 Tax=Streptomyces sp. NPDC020875 TaxID=3154898 RepID=UPI0033F61321
MTDVLFDNGWRATVTGRPLTFTPRFTGDSVLLVDYANVKDREGSALDTFGSQHQLWDTPDVFRFDRTARMLVGAELQLPYASAYGETSDRLPSLPPVRPGGLRADEVRDFRQEMCAVVCRGPEDSVLVNLRDLDVLGKPLEVRIGIAPGVALLVQDGSVVGWDLTDPARYLSTAYTAPDPSPPSSATRRLLTECLDLLTGPVVDDLVDGEPTAVARLLAADAALRAQREDRHRADVLLDLIATYMEDYGSG